MLSFVLMLAAALVTPQPDPQVADLQIVRAADMRIARIGERLAIANVALCPRTQGRTGLVLHDIRQYPGLPLATAQRAFGFEAPVAAEAVVPGSAAARAGIAADSAILAIDGQAIDAMGGAKGQPPAYARMAAVLDRLDGLAEDGSVTLDMVEKGARRAVRLMPERGCRARFQLVTGGLNAASDGLYVKLNSALFDFVRGDDELAAVLAHELAHIILDHRNRLNAAGVDRGIFGGMGKSGRLILATEVEADRLAVYLMANAGYDPHAAPTFWDRYGRAQGLGILSDGTHLRRKARVALAEGEIMALEKLRAGTAKGAALIPDFARRPFAPLR